MQRKPLVYDASLHRYKSNWEVAWHPQRCRYYYRDTVTGNSRWLQPEGENLNVPQKPPKHVDTDTLDVEEGADGWSKVLDRETGKHFYFLASSGKRTWYAPIDSVFRQRAGYEEDEDDFVIAKPHRGTQEDGGRRDTEDNTLSDLWKPEEFLMKMESLQNKKVSLHNHDEDVVLHISGGRDPEMSRLRGVYHFFGDTHGKPTYKKIGQPVMVYYYNDRGQDAVFCSGWWIAMEKRTPNKETEWTYHAYHPDKLARGPPSTGWYFPNKDDARIFEGEYTEAHTDDSFSIKEDSANSQKAKKNHAHADDNPDLRNAMRAMLRQVMSSNDDHINVKSLDEYMPKTIPVTFRECVEALQARKVSSFRLPTSVTMSNRTTTDAICSYAQDKKRTVCALNFASGTKRQFENLTKETSKMDTTGADEGAVAMCFCNNPHDKAQTRRSLVFFFRNWNKVLRHKGSKKTGSLDQAEERTRCLELGKDNDTQEADLCRRIGLLHKSLIESRGHNDQDLYPFGPPTCTDPSRPNQYCDVLFTPCSGIDPVTKNPLSLDITRGPEEDGFPILNERDFCKVCVVSAVPPCLHTSIEEVENVQEECFIVSCAGIKEVNGRYQRCVKTEGTKEEWVNKDNDSGYMMTWSLEIHDWVIGKYGEFVYRANSSCDKVPRESLWIALGAPGVRVTLQDETHDYAVSGSARASANGLYREETVDTKRAWVHRDPTLHDEHRIELSVEENDWVIVNMYGEVLYHCRSQSIGPDGRKQIPVDSTWAPRSEPHDNICFQTSLVVSGASKSSANGRYVLSKDKWCDKEVWIKVGTTMKRKTKDAELPSQDNLEYRVQWSKVVNAWVIQNIHEPPLYLCKSTEGDGVPRNAEWVASAEGGPNATVVFKEHLVVFCLDNVVGDQHKQPDGIYARGESKDGKEVWIKDDGMYRIQWSTQNDEWRLEDQRGNALFVCVSHAPRDVEWTPTTSIARGYHRNPVSQYQDGKVEERPADIWDQKLLFQLVTTMFVAPMLKEPHCTTLILGAWGCGDRHDCNPQDIAQLFAQAIIRDFPALDLCLGRLYHEIHFAIPCNEDSTRDEKSNYGIFRRVFLQNSIEVKEVIIPDKDKLVTI